MTNLKFPPIWLSWIVAGANILAIAELPYGYYQLLRLVVTGYAAYIAYLYFKRGIAAWGWGFGFIALLYNPLFIITMSKEFHAIVNLGVAAAIIAELKIARSIFGETRKHDGVIHPAVPVIENSQSVPPQESRHWMPALVGSTLKVIGVLALMAIAATVAIKMSSKTADVKEVAMPTSNSSYLNALEDVVQSPQQQFPPTDETATSEYQRYRNIYDVAEDPFSQSVASDADSVRSNSNEFDPVN